MCPRRRVVRWLRVSPHQFPPGDPDRADRSRDCRRAARAAGRQRAPVIVANPRPMMAAYPRCARRTARTPSYRLAFLYGAPGVSSAVGGLRLGGGRRSAERDGTPPRVGRPGEPPHRRGDQPGCPPRRLREMPDVLTGVLLDYAPDSACPSHQRMSTTLSSLNSPTV